MRRLLCGFVLALVVSLPATAEMTAVVTEDATPCAQLRVAPKSTATRIGCLPPGTTVEVIASSPYWRQVHHGKRIGWVAKKFLQTTSAAPAAASEPERWLEVHVVDVGQGDGIWIHTADDGVPNGRFEGRNIVIDGGPDRNDAANQLYKYLKTFAHEDAVVDALVISHPHTDHYRGANSILDHYDVKAIYDPGFPKGGVEYPKFREKLQGQSDAAIMIGRDSFTPPNWGSELDVEILHSFGIAGVDLGSKDNTKENNSSIVLRLQYGKHTFLFMGDAEGKDRHDDPATAHYIEDFLLRSVPPARLKATVLKIGHHGSETSSSMPFIEAVSPEILVVSSGRKDFGRGDNHVFLPDMSTLRRYCCHDPATRIYRTDQDDEAEGLTDTTDADGDHIVIRTNGETITVQAFSAGVPITMDACHPGCEED